MVISVTSKLHFHILTALPRKIVLINTKQWVRINQTENGLATSWMSGI